MYRILNPSRTPVLNLSQTGPVVQEPAAQVLDLSVPHSSGRQLGHISEQVSKKKKND